MGISDGGSFNPNAPGVKKPITIGRVTVPPTSTSGPINQLRGLASKGSTGAGIPRHVTNVSASITAAAKGATSTVTVAFQRDPSDNAFSKVNVYVRGYQGNQSLVQIGGGSESPITFTLSNTGEPINVLVQASGNSGDAPISTAPSRGIKLPLSASGGYGPSSQFGVSISGNPQAGELTKWASGTSITNGDLSGDAQTTGSTAVTVKGIQTIPVSAATPNTGDILRYNVAGDSKWDIASGMGRFIMCQCDANSSPFTVGNGEVPAFIGTQAKFGALSVDPMGNSFTSAATASANVTAGIRFGWGAALGADQFTYGTTWRVSIRARMNNTTNARYWIGTTDGATGDFSGSAGLASDAPTRTMAAFRYSNGVDTNIQAVCAVSGTQTIVNTGIAPNTTNSQLFEIAFVAGSKFNFYIDGSLVASITTHVPAASDRFGVFVCSDNKNTNTAVGFNWYHHMLTLK